MFLPRVLILLVLSATSYGLNIKGLETCLRKFLMPEDIILPSSPSYESVRNGERIRIQRHPAVVVFVKTYSHVQASVICATRNGYHPTPRAGGHSYDYK
jgi:FAD/FMN-containing dehydrogenase